MRIDGLSSGQAQEIQGIGDILGRLQVGDIIKAKILEIAGGEVLLKMFDGTEFKAATAAKIDAGPGDIIELMVSGREDSRLFMETIKKSDGSSKDIGSQLKLELEKLAFTPDDKNLEIASSIKTKGLPISKDIIDKAVTLMKNFAGISSDNAVFLASKGINPPEKNTSMLINLLDGRLKLGKGLDELLNQLSSVSGELAGMSDNDTGSISNQSNGIAGTGSKSMPDVSEMPAAAGNGAASRQANQTDQSKSLTSLPGNLSEDAINSSNSLSFLKQEAADARLQSSRISDAAQKLQELLMQKSEGEKNDSVKNTAPEKDLSELHSAAQGKGEAAASENTRETARAAVKMLKEAGELFVRVESDSFKSDIEVKKLFGNIIDRLDNMKELLLSSSIPGRDELLNKLGAVEDSMRLLNYIGSNTMYAQIPVNMQGFNTTAELFVMKREAHRKRIDPGNAVLFLSLDTHNIGTVQSIVEIKGKNIGVNLRAESPEIIDFIKENMTGLYNSLSQNGFKLVDVRYRLITEPAGLADMEKVIGEEFKERLKGVDLRI